MKNLFLFVLLLVASAECILLITGKVSNNSVRILYESSNSNENQKEIFVILKNLKNSKEVQKKKILLENHPKIIKFENLSLNSEFKVEFNVEKKINENFVTFKTFSNEKQKKIKFLVMSCDRYVDDKDDEFYSELMKKDSNFDVVLHLGDQIYADVIGKNMTDDQSYEDILEEYRKLYRLTWGTSIKQQFFRKGSHLMIPDDHDIINNLDAPLLYTHLQEMLFAGRQAYY